MREGETYGGRARVRISWERDGVFFLAHFPLGERKLTFRETSELLPHVSLKCGRTEWLVPHCPNRRTGRKGRNENTLHPTGAWTNLCASRGSCGETLERSRNGVILKGTPRWARCPQLSTETVTWLRLFLTPGRGPSFFQRQEENIQDNMVGRVWY